MEDEEGTKRNRDAKSNECKRNEKRRDEIEE
jgi:hypothetical protein